LQGLDQLGHFLTSPARPTSGNALQVEAISRDRFRRYASLIA